MFPAVCREPTIGELIEKTNRGNEDKDRYGVHLNEMKHLGMQEDFFDCAEDVGQNPPFLEECNKPVVFANVDLGEGRAVDIMQGAFSIFLVGYTIVLYGPRRSGKSMLVRNIAQRMRHLFTEVIVFTMTKDSGEYFGYVPYNRVIQGLDEELLLKLLKLQADKKRRETLGEDLGNYNMLIIIDDCMAEKLRYKDIFNMLFYNGRHYCITLIVTVQDVKGIAPAASINTDIACTFSLPDNRGRETMREKFADYLNRREFNALMDAPEVNKKYHIIMFDVAHRYNPIDRRISIACIDPEQEEKFVLGNRKVWLGNEKQLIDLGLQHLLELRDWGIIGDKSV